MRSTLLRSLNTWRGRRNPIPTITEAIEEALVRMLRRDGILKEPRTNGKKSK